MKQDIDFGKVEGIQVTIAREEENGDASWKVFLINDNDFDIDNVIVSSNGYGEQAGEPQKTSTLRHYIAHVAANSFAPVETIQPEVFHLYNQYWVSYYVEGKILDKKFIFVPDSIVEENMQFIPQINLEGILHS